MFIAEYYGDAIILRVPKIFRNFIRVFGWSVEIDLSRIMEVLPHRNIWTPTTMTAEEQVLPSQYYHHHSTNHFRYSPPQSHQYWSSYPYSTWQNSYSNSWNNDLVIMTHFYETINIFFREVLLNTSNE